MADNIALLKSKSFALRIVRLYQYLCDDKKEFILSKQVLRSGTSVGANLAESECAISKKDFTSKVYIALKECVETQYWLELLKNAEYISKKEYDSVYKDCNEITKILMKTTKTISKNN